MSDFFDQRARQQAGLASKTEAAGADGTGGQPEFDPQTVIASKNEAAGASGTRGKAEFDATTLLVAAADAAAQTPRAIKAAVQELLRTGLIEAEARPKLYDTLRQHPREVAQALEPLDLQVRLDEVRGLAWLSVGQGFAGDESPAAAAGEDVAAEPPVPGEGWSHPLVRRQRLTLEQSLLLALLRQHYLAHEQQAGIGGGVARVALAELGAELASYLRESGSDQKDDKRLRQLLAALKDHGVVGEPDGSDQVPIRPLIAHVANPDTLLAMLRQFEALGAEGGETANHPPNG